MQLVWGFHPIYFYATPVVLLAILAFCRNDSMWGTMIKMFNIFFATMVAINWFEPLANLFDSFMSPMLYYNDLLAYLALFTVTLAILVEVSNRLSRIDVFFPRQANLIGTYAMLFVLFVGYYSISVYMLTATLPEAPRKEFNAPPLLKILNFESANGLAPLVESNTFDAEAILKKQNDRNYAVYDIVDKEDGTWRFSGSSPNL